MLGLVVGLLDFAGDNLLALQLQVLAHSLTLNQGPALRAGQVGYFAV